LVLEPIAAAVVGDTNFGRGDDHHNLLTTVVLHGCCQVVQVGIEEARAHGAETEIGAETGQVEVELGVVTSQTAVATCGVGSLAELGKIAELVNSDSKTLVRWGNTDTSLCLGQGKRLQPSSDGFDDCNKTVLGTLVWLERLE